MKLFADDRFLALDKLEHIVWAFVTWTMLAALTRASFLVLLGLFGIAAVGVELVELWRFWRWDGKGRPQPWPWLTDQFSYRDLVADVVGAALAAGALWKICR